MVLEQLLQVFIELNKNFPTPLPPPKKMEHFWKYFPSEMENQMYILIAWGGGLPGRSS